MKNKLTFAFFFALLLLVCSATYAQSEDSRTQLKLSISYGGKTIVTDLNSVSTSFSRVYDEVKPNNTATDSVKNKMPNLYSSGFYMTIDVKKISDELLKVFAKKQAKFDGTITIVDTFGKNPSKTIKFKQASVYSYSDQFSSASYGDAYGATALSILCGEVSINGILIEQ